MKAHNKAAQLYTEEAEQHHEQHDTSPAQKGHPQLGGGTAYESHGATSCCSLPPASLSRLTEPCPFAERPSEDSDVVYLFDTLGQNNCTTGDLVDSEAECLKAARAFNGVDASMTYSGSWSRYPKGCMKTSGTTFSYNSHSTGAAHSSEGPVCQLPKTTEDRVAALEQMIDGCPYDWKQEDDAAGCALEMCEVGHQHYETATRMCKFMCNPNCDVSLAHRTYAVPT